MSLLFYTPLDNSFSDLYIETRKKENRFYSEEQIRILPTVEKSNIHFREWQMKKKSATRFTNYLKNKKKQLYILEIGCGNGWFSNLMSTVENTKVIGLDINLPELQLADKIFQKNNLAFAFGDLYESSEIYNQKFDIIVFNSSIQYFKDIAMLFKITKNMLSKNGELHIIDSPFYENSTIENAKERTRSYYKSIGYPEMINNYFHYKLEDLRNYKIRHKPPPRLIRFFKSESPFYWVEVF